MQHEALLGQLLVRLEKIQGICAIVLGGSYASGIQRPDSDIDIGLYYDQGQGLDITHIRALANELNDTPGPLVTDLQEWGPWVNGGAWLTIGSQRVDFLYRDLAFVERTIEECHEGVIRSHYWQQPAYGFHNYIYCAEIAFCQSLYDKTGHIAQLKSLVKAYPSRLKAAICKDFLWRGRFTLDNTHKAATRGEVAERCM